MPSAQPMPGPLALPPPRASFAEAVADLERYGLAIVENALSPNELATLRARIVEQAAGERAAGVASLEYAGANQRVWNLVNKGEVFEDLLHHPLIREAMRHVLQGRFCISSYTANIAGHGGEAMVLHADQGYVPIEIDIPLVANMLWMLDDFTEENGATRVVPGSHRSRAYPDPRHEIASVAATGKAGSVLIFDGRLWHGTGRNLTHAPRHALLTYFCRPFVRPQENCTLSVAPDVLGRATPWLKELLGFRVWRSLGGVEGPLGVGTPKAPVETDTDANDEDFPRFIGPFVQRPDAPIRVLKP